MNIIKKGENIMSSNNISESKRILSFVMGIIMLVMILFSGFYIAHEIDHDCSGEDCPICICITQCESLLELISCATANNIEISFNTCIIILSVCFPVLFFIHKTLILKKVRLNN